MPDVHRLTPRHGDVLVLAGTTKGLFVLRSNARRQRWEIGGPQFPGAEVYAVAGVRRNGDLTLWAANGNPHFGTFLSRSTDFGASWVTPEEASIRFPEDTGAALRRVWQIQPGIEPGVLYAGVEPSALFVSRDDGRSWTLVRGLWDHPHRERWTPGGGGQCLHTIVPHPTDPDRMLVAMSTGGVYRTEDGGRTWQARNVGVRAEFLPDKYPEFGQCVHKVVRHPSHPDRLFLQNHWGLYRSDDGGDSWQDIAHGVPSDFGFAMAMHPHDAETVYIVPIESDRFRCTPEAKLRVYRTRDAGGSWEPLTRGLPQKNALETILRDGMAVDALNPAGVYFGTRSGSVWASANGGASWTEAATGLPPVMSVRAVVVGNPAGVRVPRATAARSANKRATRRARPARRTATRATGRARAGARPRARAKARPSARAATRARAGGRARGAKKK